MSLLTAPRHRVTVQGYTKQAGTAGSVYAPHGDPVVVPANVHPLSTTELTNLGLQASDTRRVHARIWPGDMHSRVTFQGAEWDQVAPAQLYDMSPATTHYEVIIRRRGEHG